MLLELIGILAGIAIFIYSIEQLSWQLLQFSKEKLKDILQKFTDHPLKALGTGLIATVLIQSSTATTSILVSLVNSGLISFSQSFGVIAGAHIGTTLTAQLVAFQFMGIAPLFIVVGFALSLFQKYSLIGKSVFLFGLVFFGLSIISSESSTLKDDSLVLSLINSIDSPVYAIGIGILLTLVLQSSSVVTALTVLFTMEGILPFTIAIPLVLGSNIGTTSTVLFVSKDMDIFAKRTAWAHVLFSVAGVVLVFPFLSDFTSYVSSVSSSPGHLVANAHTIFNIVAAAMFLAISPVFAKIIEKFIPSREKEILFQPKYIKKVPKDTDLAITKVRLELINHLRISKEMFDLATDMVVMKDVSKLQAIEKYESLSDYLDKKITSVLVTVSQRNLSERQSKEIINLSKIANETEKLADIAHDYAYINVKLKDNGLELSKESIRDILKVKMVIDEIYDVLFLNFNHLDRRNVLKIIKMRKNADKLISSSHKLRIRLLSRDKFGIYATVLFVDAISSFEDAASILVRITRNAER